MILKAIVEDIVDDYTLKIRIPRYNKVVNAFSSTPYNYLYEAPICALPGIYPNYEINDTVFVGFEEDLDYQPIVLGKLYCNNNMKSKSSIDAISLSVEDKTTLSNNTHIGKITKENLQDVKSLEVNSSTESFQLIQFCINFLDFGEPLIFVTTEENSVWKDFIDSNFNPVYELNGNKIFSYDNDQESPKVLFKGVTLKDKDSNEILITDKISGTNYYSA